MRDYGTASWDGGDPACDHTQTRGTTRGGPHSTITGGQDLTAHVAQYQHECGKCGARRVDSQIGLEPTVQAYVAEMVAVFREVKRVLRDDGVLWLNLGSSYASGRMEADEYVMRDNLTDEERAYVYAELAKSAAMPAVRQADAPAEPDVSSVPHGREGATRELPDEVV